MTIRLTRSIWRSKAELKRLLHLEAFGTEPVWDHSAHGCGTPLVEQKNLGLVTDIIDRTLAYDAGAKFIVLAAAGDDRGGQATENDLRPICGSLPRSGLFRQSV